MGKTIITALFALMLCIPTLSKGQPSSEIVTLSQTGTFFEVDPLGNIYIVDGNKMVKMNQNNEVLAQYSARNMGNITSISVVNSMKIFLFYQESGSLVFLDDHLSPIGNPIDLFSKNYSQISLASYSTQNQIRLFDPFANEIIILDFFGNEISRNNFSFSLQKATKIIELGQNQFAIQDGEQGVFLFDNFGTFSKQVLFVTHQPLFSQNHLLYYTENNKLHGYDYVKLSSMERELDTTNVKMGQIYQNKIIILKNE